MLKALFSLVFAAVMWVQVPQWQPDWSECSVDTPDVDCHWYVTAPDNTFDEPFSWGWLAPSAQIRTLVLVPPGEWHWS